MVHNGYASAVNDSPGKVVDIVCDCDFLWSLAHNFCYERLNINSLGFLSELFISDRFVDRARKIAATYARFYLEEEEGGDPSKKGRYYWMALGAFASKTVACLLDTPQLRAMAISSKAPAAAVPIFEPFSRAIKALKPETVPLGLGKGNLWLFIDIAASHWFYNNYPDDFKLGMKCEKKRGKNNLTPEIKKFTENIRWADSALPELNYFKPSEEVIEGFKLIKRIESDNQNRKALQLNSLMSIAKHEQLTVLQNLVYNDSAFANYTKGERFTIKNKKTFKPFTPDYKIVFTSQCHTDNKFFENMAPDDLKFEDEISRMKWINNVAIQFHQLMLDENETMEI